MLRELWTFITNLGTSNKLTPFDHRAIRLMNQLSFVMMIWFAILSIIGLLDFKPIPFLITASNIVFFGGVLLFNSFGKVVLCKNYFMIFGLVMVTFVNMAFGPSGFPMVQFIPTAVFPILIFKKLRTYLIYLGLNLVCLLFIFYYHQNYTPLIINATESGLSTAYLILIIVMIVVFLISLFFRNVGEDLEWILEEKNRHVNDHLEKIQSLQEQLIRSEKMASLGQLTAGIAHEIKNPINFVSANVSPLKRDLKELNELCMRYYSLHHSKDPGKELKSIADFKREIDPEFLSKEIDTLINGIEEGAERTRQIVTGLKNFSRIDENDFKTADIHEGIESTLMLLRNKLKNRVEVVKHYGDIPPIDCVPGKINQVLMNVLINASDAIGDAGVITITTRRGEHSDVVISIKDDGPGMKESVKRRIFEPFYTTKAIGQGTGLGLSISYGIIEQHNGNIQVISETGKGAEFLISLPVKQTDKSIHSGKKGF